MKRDNGRQNSKMSPKASLYHPRHRRKWGTTFVHDYLMLQDKSNFEDVSSIITVTKLF